MPSRYVLSVLEKHGDDSLRAEGWTGDKAWLANFDTRTSVTIAQLDITAGLPKSELPTR